MGTVYSFPEVLKYTELGKYTLVAFDLVIPSAFADPTRPGSLATIVTLGVARDEKILTERYNWGDTSSPSKVYYELQYERGLYCGNTIRKSNQENHCTHLQVARFIDIYLWNISSPAIDVYVDFSCWYFTYPLINEPQIRELLTKWREGIEAIAANTGKFAGV